ncbi:MAG: hypothetical protein NWE93_04730 [Candidatus Bathyarchaeota archaeon]|nr:hypothetical protein [Candidatus Bathyarchaeota archaeon]
MYHANGFELTKANDLPVYTYGAVIKPEPVNHPQFYQILGILAKRLMYEQRIPIVSIEGLIEALPTPISGPMEHSVSLPEVGNFIVSLKLLNQSKIGLSDFENYSHLVNRLADVALTIYSKEYYKFHPKAPNILRDEPYFDKGLIEKTGILDSKSYYRGLMNLNGKIVFVLNRETQLRSNKNLLIELKSIKKTFEEKNETEIDFYDPPPNFVSFANYLLKGKAADIAHSAYPGPSIKKINSITWSFRAGDKTPGMNDTPADYLKNTYGIKDIDLKQPLVVYETGDGKVRYQIPQILSVGHNFEDLAKRISRWQRTQVWGSIHPDCKNQLHKIFDIIVEIDRNLRRNIPELYPNLVEISTKTIDVSSLVSQPMEIKLAFANKEISIKPPYDTNFYRSYSNKALTFSKAIPAPKILVCVEKETQLITNFLEQLSAEYERRTNTSIIYGHAPLKPDETYQYTTYDLVLTIGSDSEEDEERYSWYKQILQNKIGIPHQNVTLENADENSIMQLVMQICLKLGGDPWLLPKNELPPIISVNSYLNPFTEKKYVLILGVDNEGHILEQSEPFTEERFDDALKKLLELNSTYKRVIYLTSFDRFLLFDELKKRLDQTSNEYCFTHVVDNSPFRFFETFAPRKAPVFGKNLPELTQCPVEAFESAPQGRILKSNENTYYLLTGKTIEKDALKRGCPTPIQFIIGESKGTSWNNEQLANHIMALCMMGRASGHMTRLPMPLYYLQSLGYYINKFGMPENPSIKRKIFYV